MKTFELSGSLGAALAAALEAATQDHDHGPKAHERAMEYAIGKPKIAKMEPVTKPTVTKVKDGVIHLEDPEPKDPEDPHTTILLRNPVKPTRWRFWNLCPRGHMAVSYRLKGDEETAIRLASVIMDIGQGRIEVTSELLEDDEDE